MVTNASGQLLLPTGWLHHAAQHYTRMPALLLSDDVYDYATLYSLSAQLCQVLRSRGLKPGATIVVTSRSAPLLAFMLHAALIADYVLFPLDPRLPDGRRQHLLDTINADLMIIEDDAVRPLDDELFLTATGLLTQAVQEKPLFEVKSPVSSAGPRLLLASSGSSGMPKLIGLSDCNLQASVNAVNECLGLTLVSVWLDCLPLVHIGGLSILLRCVNAGSTVVLHDGFDAVAVMKDLHDHQVTHISLVPAMLAQLLELEEKPPESLQVALIGGAPLAPVLARKALKAGWPLWVTYGMTETASMLTARKLDGEDDDPQQVGDPLNGFEVCLEDDVIQVRGEAVHGNAHGTKGQWFLTGDRGRFDGAGHLHVLGRKDNMLLSGGEKVDPEAVEQLLANCPGVDEVAVTGREDPVWGERIVAVYSGDIDEPELAQLCRDGIKGVMRPRVFLKVESLPRTANGKLDRRVLRMLAAE